MQKKLQCVAITFKIWVQLTKARKIRVKIAAMSLLHLFVLKSCRPSELCTL